MCALAICWAHFAACLFAHVSVQSQGHMCCTLCIAGHFHMTTVTLVTCMAAVAWACPCMHRAYVSVACVLEHYMHAFRHAWLRVIFYTGNTGEESTSVHCFSFLSLENSEASHGRYKHGSNMYDPPSAITFSRLSQAHVMYHIMLSRHPDRGCKILYL